MSKYSKDDKQQAQDAVMLTTAVFAEILPLPAYDVYLATNLLRDAGIGPKAFASFFKKVITESSVSVKDMASLSLASVTYHMLASLLGLPSSWFASFYLLTFDNEQVDIATQHKNWDTVSESLDGVAEANAQIYKVLRGEVDKLKPEQSLIQIAIK